MLSYEPKTNVTQRMHGVIVSASTGTVKATVDAMAAPTITSDCSCLY